MNRRSFLKKALGSFLTIVGLSGGSYYYAREIEPSLLQISNETILNTKIPNEFNHFKIVQFSDTHIGFNYTLEQLQTLVSKINEQNPDLIVFTGDLVDEPHTYNWNEKLVDILGGLDAPHGKYWIYGNHDHGGYGTDIVRNVMDKANFKLLKNEHATISVNNAKITLAGVDDLMLGRPNLDTALNNADSNLFTLLLAHEPDFADTTKHFPIDVQLSGHSHGGQVRFPFIGHLYTPAYAEKYVQGKHILHNEKLHLYVNRGIGTTRLPYRFLCKPELHVFTLTNN
ncbi:metallophosphoesterase [Virgibacillus byunsanensis]|uniref:Metallophosphoesterase n=1 Tax=Virgibacillus byunsanensis TaxID=570945 RepID=A0ABW3LQM3_9BACI